MAEFDPKRREQLPKKRKPSRSRRFETINEFVDEQIQTMTRSEITVFLFLWRHADSSNQVQCSHGQIANAVGVSRRAAITAVQGLESRGVIRCIWRSGLNQERGNKYRITTK